MFRYYVVGTELRRRRKRNWGAGHPSGDGSLRAAVVQFGLSKYIFVRGYILTRLLPVFIYLCGSESHIFVKK